MDIDRRKLLKGSAAVPIILTVRPAAATARSSLNACMDNDAHRPTPQILKSTHRPDEYMRVRIDVLALSVWDDGKKKWQALENRKFFLGVDTFTYWELDKYDPYSAPALPTSMKKGTGVHQTKIDERLALAYYGLDGYRGYAWETKGGTHCTKSCWASVKPKYG